MMRIYRDRPEAYLEDTVKLLEILPMLNLQWRRTRKKKKNPALLRATKSMKEYKRFEMKLCVNFYVGELFAREFLCR
jgi:hypothetical protein